MRESERVDLLLVSFEDTANGSLRDIPDLEIDEHIKIWSQETE